MPVISENEKLIRKFHPSRWHFWQIYLVAGLAAIFASGLSFFPVVFRTFGNFEIEGFGNFQIPGLVIAMIFLFFPVLVGFAELLRLAHTYYITDKRVIEGFSFVSRRYISTSYARIQNSTVKQSLFGRVVGIGDLEFHTAGFGGESKPEIAFRGVVDPIGLKRIVDEIKLKEISGHRPGI